MLVSESAVGCSCWLVHWTWVIESVKTCPILLLTSLFRKETTHAYMWLKPQWVCVPGPFSTGEGKKSGRVHMKATFSLWKKYRTHLTWNFRVQVIQLATRVREERWGLCLGPSACSWLSSCVRSLKHALVVLWTTRGREGGQWPMRVCLARQEAESIIKLETRWWTWWSIWLLHT